MSTLTPDDCQRAYTVDEACIRLGNIGRTTFYELVSSGAITARKLGHRTVVLQSEITRFLDNLPTVESDQ